MDNDRNTMQQNIFFLKPKVIFIFILSVFFLSGLLLLEGYQYQINADGVSYLAIAQKYQRGDFRDAINGYWGPLFSWLLVPILFFGSPPLLAAKILSLLIGLATLIGIRSLSYRFEISELHRNLMLLSLIPVILFFAFCVITPDLLILGVLIYYLTVIFDSAYRRDKNKGALCGALGSFAYFAKSFGFPFFIAHFLCFNCWHYLQSATSVEKKIVLQNFTSALAVFGLLSGSWIYLLSHKYQHLTFSTSATYAFTLLDSQLSSFAVSKPGLLPPPNNTAASAWEDPSFKKSAIQDQTASSNDPAESHSILSPSAHIKLIDRVRHNAPTLQKHLQYFSVFSSIIILAAFLSCLRLAKIKPSPGGLYALATLAIYCGGYMLIFIEARYIWIAWILIVLMGFHLFSRLSRPALAIKIGVMIILLGFVLSYGQKPAKFLANNLHTGKNLYLLSKQLKEHYDIHGNIASNDHWVSLIGLAFYNNYKYFGRVGENLTFEELQHELDDNDIDYYFVMSPQLKFLLKRGNTASKRDQDNFAHDDFNSSQRDMHDFFSKYKEITQGKISGLRIYSLKNSEKH